MPSISFSIMITVISHRGKWIFPNSHDWSWWDPSKLVWGAKPASAPRLGHLESLCFSCTSVAQSCCKSLKPTGKLRSTAQSRTLSLCKELCLLRTYPEVWSVWGRKALWSQSGTELRASYRIRRPGKRQIPLRNEAEAIYLRAEEGLFSPLASHFFPSVQQTG